MAGEDELFSEEQIPPLDPSLSMVVFRESSILSEDDLFVFPPINHENLHVASSIYNGVDSYLETPSESSSPSSSSRRSASSSSSFSLLPSDSDVQMTLSEFGFDLKPPSETEGKSPPSLSVESSPSDSNGKSPWHLESEIIRDWWELLLVRASSKLKNLLTWFSTNLRSYYPGLAIVIWWWMRVRARRRRVATDNLRNSIKERDQRIVQLLHQIAEMNELLIKQHKDIVSRR